LDGFPEDGKDGKERKHLILSKAKDLTHEFRKSAESTPRCTRDEE
jgi:hypothetical protein